MRSIVFVVLAIILISASMGAWAASTAGIVVPSAGDHYYWFVYTDINGKQVTTTPRGFKEKKTVADLPLVKDALPKLCTLYVLDAKSGNEAVIKASGKPDFKLKASDFNWVRRVEIEVTSATSGAPAAAASVKLEDSEKKATTQILDPSARGKISFIDAASGTAKVTVEYGDGKTTSQDIDIAVDRKEPIPSVKIPVVGDIETTSLPASDSKSAPAAGEGSPNDGMSFPHALVGLLLLGGIVYMAIRTMSNRGAKVRELLKNAGIELPEDEDSAAEPFVPAQPVDPSICPFCGGRKDPATGACSCSIGSGSPVTVGSGGGPRLVCIQGTGVGSIYQVNAEPVTIGREESNTIALPQDNTTSRRHARVACSGGQCTVFDEGSSNGTFVNGVRINEQILRPGDEVQVGGTRLRFEA